MVTMALLAVAGVGLLAAGLTAPQTVDAALERAGVPDGWRDAPLLGGAVAGFGGAAAAAIAATPLGIIGAAPVGVIGAVSVAAAARAAVAGGGSSAAEVWPEGATGVVTELHEQGRYQVTLEGGSQWPAQCEEPVVQGAPVRVTAVHGGVVVVRPHARHAPPDESEEA